MNVKYSILKNPSVIILILFVGVSGCKEDGPTVQEQVEALLVSGEWNNPTVTADGVDQSDLYLNFTIKFSKNTYASSGGNPLWASTGTWVFTDESAKTLNLDNKTEVQIMEITEANLELAVQNSNTTFGSGRVQSVKGKNLFKLKKK